MPDRDEVAARCRLIIAEHFRCAPTKVSEDSSLLFDDLETDSLDSIDITLDCEHEFDIEIADWEASSVTNVRDLVELVVRKVSLLDAVPSW